MEWVGSGPREVLGGRIRRRHRSTCRITEESGPQILCQLFYSPLLCLGLVFSFFCFVFFFYPSLAFYALIIKCTHSLHNGSSDQVMNALSPQHRLEPSTPATTMSCSPQPFFFFFLSLSIAWPELGVESLWGAGHAPTEK